MPVNLDNLRRRMKECGWKAKPLSLKLGRNPRWIADMFRDKSRQPNPVWFAQLADELCTTVEYLRGETAPFEPDMALLSVAAAAAHASFHADGLPDQETLFGDFVALIYQRLVELQRDGKGVTTIDEAKRLVPNILNRLLMERLRRAGHGDKS